MQLVLIDWVDSYGCSPSWQTLEPINPALMVCHSVGWLVHDGDDCKVIVPHLADSEPTTHRQGCGDMTIPTKAILRIVPLEQPNQAPISAPA
jgi:hypothetical protein